MAFADLIQREVAVPSDVQQATALIPSDGTWTEHTSAEDTLMFLATNQINSYRALLENCRIMDTAKRLWSGKNETPVHETDTKGKITTKHVDDWMRFKDTLQEHFGFTDSWIMMMSKVWQNILEKGSIYYVLNHTAYLPNSITSLYEISTVKITDTYGERILDSIVKMMREAGNSISLTEIRNIKKRNGAEVQKLVTDFVKKDPKLTVTKLKLPSDVSALKKVDEKWKEIEEAINKINGLGLIQIETETPRTLLDAEKKKEEVKERKSHFRFWQKTISQFALDDVDAIASIKINRTKGNKDSEKTANAKVDDFINFCGLNPDFKIECQSELNDWKDRMEQASKLNEDKVKAFKGKRFSEFLKEFNKEELDLDKEVGKAGAPMSDEDAIKLMKNKQREK